MGTNDQQPELPFNEPVLRSSALSFERAAILFLQHCRDRCLADNTVRAYGSDFADFSLFAGDVRAAVEIDAPTLQSYARRMREGQGRTPSTVRRRLASIRAMFRWLEKGKLVSPSPFSGLDLSVRLPRRLPKALATEETSRLLTRARLEARSRGAEGHDSLMAHFVVVTLITTGLRIGELTAVRVTDVSLSEGCIQVRGKGDRERRVYMPGHQALAILANYMASRDRVRTLHDRMLALADGRPATTHQMRRILGGLAARAGVGRRVTPHVSATHGARLNCLRPESTSASFNDCLDTAASPRRRSTHTSAT